VVHRELRTFIMALRELHHRLIRFSQVHMIQLVGDGINLADLSEFTLRFSDRKEKAYTESIDQVSVTVGPV
jgi:hypothetical protein